jgi:hypothetical protein
MKVKFRRVGALEVAPNPATNATAITQSPEEERPSDE